VSSADAVAAVLWIGVTLYAVLGGADFGSGFWTLVAGRGERGRRVRDLVDWAIGPVWEANHVWLIFVLVLLWTGFPEAFASVMSTLFIPLTLAALGIVLRGAGFAFRAAAGPRGRHAADTAFALSSVLTPFFMGTVAGAVAAGRVPVGNAAGDPVTSWLNVVSVTIGVLFVAAGAYLAAVFLVRDAQRRGDAELEAYFALRAQVMAVVTGALGVAGLVVVHADAELLYDGLTGEGLPLVVLSAVCGLATLVLLRRGARRGIRVLAVLAVVAIVWGWGAAQYPYLLPTSLTVSAGAGTDATLTTLLAVFGVAVLLVVPALALLFRLDQRNLLEEPEP
jgi:cytochrome d ubiquinol oxidase subunit II